MSGKVNYKIIWKSLVIGVLILIMLIPLLFVSGTIKGRLNYKDDASSKITESWGGPILVAAPILNIPYTIKIVDEKNKTTSTQVRYLKFTPKNLVANVNLKSQTRYIGIFKVPVFTAEIKMNGKFEKLDDVVKLNPDFSKAFITLELNDLKGMSSSPVFKWNNNNLEFEPSSLGYPLNISVPYTREYDSFLSSKRYYRSDDNNVLKSLSARVDFNNTEIPFELNFDVKGSNSITFVPIAKDNNFTISSDWTNPNFSGSFLPDTKNIDDKGFNANWKINYLASGIPTQLENATLSSSIFTISLLVPVDNYRSAERATKYGLLFIVLTFLACFIFEITSKKPIHPFQYLLVGFAMTVFYILLVSISEFISFATAYIIAASATTVLITSYFKFGVIKDLSIKKCFIIFFSLGTLYTFLYILLQLQDMALIFGSIGLFIGLAAAMYATRNISWYEEEK